MSELTTLRVSIPNEEPVVSKENQLKQHMAKSSAYIPFDKLSPTFQKSVKFYYHRDNEKRPMVTGCVIDMSFGTFKGWAICHPTKDHVNKKEGRTLALIRAIAALSEYVLNRWNRTNAGASFTMFPVERPEVNERLKDMGIYLTAKALGMPKVDKS